MKLLFILVSICKAHNPLYYNNPKMHSLGNTGFFGRIHAELAAVATKYIDRVSYNNRNIRNELLDSLPKNINILDLCCGTGTSTAENGYGVDTSMEMITRAFKTYPNKTFDIGNAETFYPNIPINITTCFFAFHEIPQVPRLNIISCMKEYTYNKIIIVDIAPNYKPKKIMQIGEPYLDDYLNNIKTDLKEFTEEIIIPNHIHSWTLNLQ